MSNSTTNNTQRLAARFAGFAYFAVIVIGMFNGLGLMPSIQVEGDLAATVNNIAANEMLFRTSIVLELAMYGLVILLAHTLYLTIKPINPGLALLASFFRLAEGIVGALLVILNIAALVLVSNATAFEPEQIQTLVGLFLDVKDLGLNIVLFLMGFGATIFCYLFFVSRYVPRILAGWGIITYIVMFLGSVIVLLFPQYTETVQMSFMPGSIFEMLFGLWLLIRSVDLQANPSGQLTTS